ncbi:MAG: glycerophosphodiester phosphodiesterase family protein [Acidobacteriota bacterium]
MRKTCAILILIAALLPAQSAGGVKVVAHRGASKMAPENTLAAIRKAIELGVDRVELDVRQTKDGVFVLMHDASVERTTNGEGRVRDLTLAEMQRLDVPTLEEALETLRGHALPDIDFKAGDPEALITQLRRFGLKDVTLSCDDAELLHGVLRVAPDLRIRPLVSVSHGGLVVLLQELNPPIVSMQWAQFSRALVDEIHQAGREVFLSTMGRKDTESGLREALDSGVDYIQTDHPELVLKLLRDARR